MKKFILKNKKFSLIVGFIFFIFLTGCDKTDEKYVENCANNEFFRYNQYSSNLFNKYLLESDLNYLLKFNEKNKISEKKLKEYFDNASKYSQIDSDKKLNPEEENTIKEQYNNQIKIYLDLPLNVKLKNPFRESTSYEQVFNECVEELRVNPLTFKAKYK